MQQQEHAVDVTRHASARWTGDLQRGQGHVTADSGAFDADYSFRSRMGDGQGGTNPEELLGAAHAGCFAMATAAALGQAGFQPASLDVRADVTLRREGTAFRIPRIVLHLTADVPRIDEARFREIAEGAKANCPVSKALGGVEEIVLDATLSRA